MKSWCFLLLCIGWGYGAFAQKPDTSVLRQVLQELNTALVQRDKATLKRLLHKHVKYTHSNAWVESRKELIDNLYNGTLNYNSISVKDIRVAIDNNVGIVRYKGDFEVLLKFKTYHFKLKVVQIWRKKKKKWQLMSRQSEAWNE